MATNAALREAITKQVVEAIESGNIPWRRPWTRSKNSGRPANLISKKPYRGINPLLLQIHQAQHGFMSRWYATFEQWRSLGCKVLKRPDHVAAGKWGCQIVFYKPIAKKVMKNGKEEQQEFFMMKTFTVFSADQVEGATRYQVEKESISSHAEALSFEPADKVIAATGATVILGGDDAYYSPAKDNIHMPERHRFNPAYAFYGTLFHELSHWAERRTGWERAGENAYAVGELIAELSSTMVCQELGVPTGESLGNQAAYMKHWLGMMRGDSGFLFKVSQQASKVTDYLLGCGEAAKDEAENEEMAAAV
jgi:antirestriction protein ArdC